MISQLINDARKIVIKFGSNTLADKNGHVNREFLEEFAKQTHALLDKGKQIVIVSSGARIAGVGTMGKWARKQDIHYKQALCAVGQVELMEAWRRSFQPFDTHIAQLLLTKDDFTDSIRTLNIRNTLFTLVDEGIVPIINENDSVCVDEIKIGDNDNLAALSGILWSADLVILFSDIDGLYDKNPKDFPDAKHIAEVKDLDAIKSSVDLGNANSFGTGGIATKIEAAQRLVSYGIPMIITNGENPWAIDELAKDNQKGTAFLPQ
jgi:glutamate 5-kinase